MTGSWSAIMEKLVTNFNIRKQFYLFTGFVCVGIAALQTAIYFGELSLINSLIASAVLAAATFGVSHYLGKLNAKRAKLIVQGLHAMSKGDLTHKVTMSGKDEFAWMCWEYSEGRKGFMGLVKDIAGSAGQLAAAAEELSAITEQSNEGVLRQQSEIEQVATAMNEMSATVTEVSRNASSAEPRRLMRMNAQKKVVKWLIRRYKRLIILLLKLNEPPKLLKI
jgi:methyl-accepting chemotaxis protein